MTIYQNILNNLKIHEMIMSSIDIHIKPNLILLPPEIAQNRLGPVSTATPKGGNYRKGS